MFGGAPGVHNQAFQLYISMLEGLIVDRWGAAEYLPIFLKTTIAINSTEMKTTIAWIRELWRVNMMGHQIAEAIIENGRLINVNKKLPTGKIKVHLIYDEDADSAEIDLSNLIGETSGIYPEINAKKESIQLREEWHRHV